jgi:GNAT superfamily N-acetyltransferase
MVTVRPATEEDRNACREAFSDHLERSKVTLRMNELMRALVGEQDLYAWVGAIDGTVAGVGMLQLIDSTDPSVFTGNPPLSVLGDTGLAKNFYVREPYRGQGVGTALLGTLLTKAAELELDAVVGEAWIRPDEKDVAPLAQKQEFTNVYQSTNYWDENGCSYCGSEASCTCEGALYMKCL